ncbi:MAG TPA: hypothetical protein VFV99_26435 [Kofleriaceae bacterium]|nr:hypothetical protein [Kofleriaceae bacterium]
MVVRILAALVTLGLLVSAADARELSAPPTAAALVDAVDDTEDVALALPPTLTPEEFHVVNDFALPEAPAGHQPCVYVFRPPRAYAFN